VHEVINGLMERSDAIIAHKLPIGAIPGGNDSPRFKNVRFNQIMCHK